MDGGRRGAELGRASKARKLRTNAPTQGSKDRARESRQEQLRDSVMTATAAITYYSGSSALRPAELLPCPALDACLGLRLCSSCSSAAHPPSHGSPSSPPPNPHHSRHIPIPAAQHQPSHFSPADGRTGGPTAAHAPCSCPGAGTHAPTRAHAPPPHTSARTPPSRNSPAQPSPVQAGKPQLTPGGP